MTALTYEERPAAGNPRGLLVLHHGRGTDELDLLGLAGVLDPEQRLHVVSPRAPLQIPGSPGYHWYLVRRIGYPDRETFEAARDALAGFHDDLWERTGLGPEHTILGGFSQGTVMSYALGLDPARPAPKGIMAFSGFIPTVEGWAPELEQRAETTSVFIAHGRRDPVISAAFAASAYRLLERAGFDVELHESDAGHGIDPVTLRAAVDWLKGSDA
jgi:phospholipase/carboxylesterase